MDYEELTAYIENLLDEYRNADPTYLSGLYRLRKQITDKILKILFLNKDI